MSRELARSTGERGYRQGKLQGRTDRRRTESARASRMTPKMIEVKRALMRLNSRPRKDLNFKTPALIMGEHRAALAA
ncbi:MAG: hypothetical protein QS721_01115 [Candidatus Endonucleobacter sp. (ex Gigantidas childressi)]|nr:hypothetical protein [Candidatus Endonucleobacter sp. (ex Gigantidas childressi)]